MEAKYLMETSITHTSHEKNKVNTANAKASMFLHEANMLQSIFFEYHWIQP